MTRICFGAAQITANRRAATGIPSSGRQEKRESLRDVRSMKAAGGLGVWITWRGGDTPLYYGAQSLRPRRFSTEAGISGARPRIEIEHGEATMARTSNKTLSSSQAVKVVYCHSRRGEGHVRTIDRASFPAGREIRGFLLALAVAAAGILAGCEQQPPASAPALPNPRIEPPAGADDAAHTSEAAQTEAADVGAAAAEAASGAKLRFAVIPKGTTHVFWRSVEAGAKKAGEELGVEIIWKGPLKENDRAEQIKVVQQFITQKVSGIVLAPLDFKALIEPVKAAREQRIPVVIFDSALDGQPGADFVSFVATNNEQGGYLGGSALAGLLGGKGDVVLLRYMVGSASTDQREAGFLKALGEHPEIKLLVDNRYAGATAGDAKTQALNMIEQLRRAGGVFAPNESSTMGMLLALRQEGLAGKIKFVGFDASPPLVAALEAGEIDALVVQNPRKMGYEAVKTLQAHLAGQTVEPVIDTGVALVTRENLNDPEIKALIAAE